MDYYIYIVRDVKADTYHPHLMLARTDAEGVRTFSDQVNSGQTPWSAHPEDYVLCRVGLFDQSKGVIESGGSPVEVQQAHLLVRNDGETAP